MDENDNLSAADAALQAAREDLDDIIRQAAEVDAPLRVISDSAFVLGYNAAPKATLHGSPSTDLYHPMQDAVEQLDSLLAEDPKAELVTIRNVLAEAVSHFLSEMRQTFARKLEEEFGEDVAKLVTSHEEVEYDEAFNFGLMLYERAKAPFYGYVMFGDDPSLSCKCSMHLAASLVERKVSPEQVKGRLKAKFNTLREALPCFGRFVIEQMRSEFQRPSPVAHQIPDEQAATQAAKDFLSRLRDS